jgi:hypothetical protein
MPSTLDETDAMNGQTLCDTGSDDEIISTYDRMLGEAPNDSALLYLRGRLCATRNQAVFRYHQCSMPPLCLNLEESEKSAHEPARIVYYMS